MTRKERDARQGQLNDLCEERERLRKLLDAVRDVDADDVACPGHMMNTTAVQRLVSEAAEVLRCLAAGDEALDDEIAILEAMTFDEGV